MIKVNGEKQLSRRSFQCYGRCSPEDRTAMHVRTAVDISGIGIVELVAKATESVADPAAATWAEAALIH